MKIEVVATSLVMLVVAVIVIGIVAIPVIEESTTGTPYKGQNPIESDPVYLAFNEDPAYTITVSGQTGTIQANGKTYTQTYAGSDLIAISDGFYLRMINDSVRIFAVDDGAITNYVTTSALTITAADGAWTVTGTASNEQTVTYTGSCTASLVRCNDGDYVMKSGQNVASKVTLGQAVYVGNLHGGNTASMFGPLRLDSFTDGVMGSAIVAAHTTSGYTIVEETCTTVANYEQTGDYQAVGQYYGFDWTSGSSTNSYVEFFVPIDFESTSVGESGTNTVLLTIIPVLLIIVSIMVAVRVIKDA